MEEICDYEFINILVYKIKYIWQHGGETVVSMICVACTVFMLLGTKVFVIHLL
jgi:hypothetical protein